MSRIAGVMMSFLTYAADSVFSFCGVRRCNCACSCLYSIKILSAFCAWFPLPSAKNMQIFRLVLWSECLLYAVFFEYIPPPGCFPSSFRPFAPVAVFEKFRLCRIPPLWKSARCPKNKLSLVKVRVFSRPLRGVFCARPGAALSCVCSCYRLANCSPGRAIGV